MPPANKGNLTSSIFIHWLLPSDTWTSGALLKTNGGNEHLCPILNLKWKMMSDFTPENNVTQDTVMWSFLCVEVNLTTPNPLRSQSRKECHILLNDNMISLISCFFLMRYITFIDLHVLNCLTSLEYIYHFIKGMTL